MTEKIDTEAVLANGKAWLETVWEGSPMDPIERRWMAFLGPCVAALEQERADAAALRERIDELLRGEKAWRQRISVLEGEAEKYERGDSEMAREPYGDE